MANITGVNPPILNDQDYVDKIVDSFNAVDAHDHTSGKGLQIPTGGIADGAITDAKLDAAAAVARSKIAVGTAHALVVNAVSGVLGELGPLTNGQLLIGSTGAAAVAAAITGTSNQVVVTNGVGSITLSAPQDIATTSAVQFGTVLAGASSIDGSAVLQANSTTKGLLPPRMTEAERDLVGTPASGLVVYNTDTNQLNVFNGTSWGAVGGGTYVDEFLITSITATNDSTQVWRYTGDSAQTLTAIDPAALSNGAVVEILGTSDTNTITIEHDDTSEGTVLNGTWVGYKYSVLTLRWNSTFDRFVEVSRNGL